MTLVVIVASIAAMCLHMHGKCLLHAAILSLSITLHMIHCYSKENSERQSYCNGVSFVICMININPWAIEKEYFRTSFHFSLDTLDQVTPL